MPPSAKKIASRSILVVALFGASRPTWAQNVAVARPAPSTPAAAPARAARAERAPVIDGDDRFAAFPLATEGFNGKQFNSTAVLRWEYRPGSALFVVWPQGRLQDDRDPGSFEAALVRPVARRLRRGSRRFPHPSLRSG